MTHANHRLPKRINTAKRCRNRPNILETISRTDAKKAFSAQLWNMDSTVQQSSYNVDACVDRYLFSRCRWHRAGSSPTGKAMEIHHPQTALPKCVGSPRGTGHAAAGYAYKSRRLAKTAASRRGQALLEFAFLIPVLIILIGGTLSLGLFFFQGNSLQQAVDIAAQEIARMPLDPEQELGLGDFERCTQSGLAANETDFKEQIYDEQFLVIRDSEWAGRPFQEFVDELPLLNRLLVPVMVRDNDMTRYPGTLVTNADGEETVLIPLVEYSQAGNSTSVGGVPETIRAGAVTIVQWVAPVEEIQVDHDTDSTTLRRGPFALQRDGEPDATLTSFTFGMVALRINYPAQSATLLNRTSEGTVVLAGNTTVNANNSFTDCYTIAAPTARISQASGEPGSNAHAGEFGLGELEALTRIVRPFRRVMSFQAIYRREVFR